jgi:hypothetical protein
MCKNVERKHEWIYGKGEEGAAPFREAADKPSKRNERG